MHRTDIILVNNKNRTKGLFSIVRTRFRSSAHQQWMMAQQAQNNIFVREWILQGKDSINQV